MEHRKAAIVLCMVVLAVTVGFFAVFHLGGAPGTGGPESVKPVRINGMPGSGGPENVHTCRWLLIPAMGGPE